MRRIVLTILAAACLITPDASAAWYFSATLYNSCLTGGYANYYINLVNSLLSNTGPFPDQSSCESSVSEIASIGYYNIVYDYQTGSTCSICYSVTSCTGSDGSCGLGGNLLGTTFGSASLDSAAGGTVDFTPLPAKEWSGWITELRQKKESRVAKAGAAEGIRE